MMSYVYVNGQIIPAQEANINVADIGFLRGYGVFDYFRAIDGQPIFMDDHLDRFDRSTQYLGLILSQSREHIKQQILQLIALSQQPLLGVRLVSTGGYAEDGYTPTAVPNLVMIAKPFVFNAFEQGLSLMTVHHQRDMPTIKTTNYIKPISLLPKLQACKADDVLYHFEGHITESSRSNICIIKDGVLITPDSGMLEGITRKRILSFAAEILPVEVRKVSLQEVFEADEVFLCGSTKRIAPVTNIDQTTFSFGKHTRMLYDRLIVEEKK